jgi:hypothetical protein
MILPKKTLRVEEERDKIKGATMVLQKFATHPRKTRSGSRRKK